MSRRPNAPYADTVSEDGTVLIYEGEDVPSSSEVPDPKLLNQELTRASGSPTQNGKFWKAAKERGATADAETVRVYEKLRTGVWVFTGSFKLRSAFEDSSDSRRVYKFRLELVAEGPAPDSSRQELEHSRIIPSAVKLEVWRRDQGRCRECGAMDNLHFDHIIPFSRGGSSLTADNIQLLCARHNLEKSHHIK
ncbi:MAG: HNH endonuclease signature motif containing protein [Planctomycetota bacterium]